MNNRNFMVVLVWVVFMANSASAEIVTVQAEGTVDFVNFSGRFGSDGSVSVGTLMSATYVYATDIPPIESGTWHATYALLSASMTIGNYTFTPYPGTEATFRVGTADPWHLIEADQLYYDGIVYFNGEAKTRNELPEVYDHIEFCDLLYATTTDPTFTDELPTTFRDISDMVRKEFGVSMSQYDGTYPDWVVSHFTINGELTSVEVIPEPAAISLMSLGALAFFRRRNRLLS